MIKIMIKIENHKIFLSFLSECATYGTELDQKYCRIREGEEYDEDKRKKFSEFVALALIKFREFQKSLRTSD